MGIRTLKSFSTKYYNRSLISLNSPNGKLLRTYYYEQTLSGKLYLASEPLKNYTTNFKAPVFLDFFYKRIVPISTVFDQESCSILSKDGYSFVSVCGNEFNFVRVSNNLGEGIQDPMQQNAGLVFKCLLDSEKGAAQMLTFGASLTFPFHPQDISQHPLVPSRLYHPIPLDSISKYGSYGVLSGEIMEMIVGDEPRDGFIQHLEKYYKINKIQAYFFNQH